MSDLESAGAPCSLTLKTEPTDFKDKEDLHSSEIPLCYGLLARFGNVVIGSECLPEKLARFECRAECDTCIVADALSNGINVVHDAVDMVATNLIKAVRLLQSAGKSLDTKQGSEQSQEP